MQGVLASTNAAQARQVLETGVINVATNAEKLALPNPSAGQLVLINEEASRVEMFLSGRSVVSLADDFTLTSSTNSGVNGDYLYTSGYGLIDGRKTYQQYINGQLSTVLVYPLSGEVSQQRWAFRLSSQSPDSAFYFGVQGQFPQHPRLVSSWFGQSASGTPFDVVVSGLSSSFSSINITTTEMEWVDIMPTLQLYVTNNSAMYVTVNGVAASQNATTYIGWVPSNEPIEFSPTLNAIKAAELDGITLLSGELLPLHTANYKTLMPMPSLANSRSFTVTII